MIAGRGLARILRVTGYLRRCGASTVGFAYSPPKDPAPAQDPEMIR